MKPAIVALLGAALGLLTPAFADDHEDLDRLAAALPKDAGAVVKRRLQCDHWAGEEPYDKARAREIAGAIRRNKCSSLERDEAATLKRYANDPKVVKAVNDAKALGEPYEPTERGRAGCRRGPGSSNAPAPVSEPVAGNITPSRREVLALPRRTSLEASSRSTR